MKGFTTIKTPGEYTVESLYELMLSKGAFGAPYELSGNGMIQCIKFPGFEKNTIIQIGARKNTINVAVAKDSLAKSLGLSMLTSGWTDILDKSKQNNQALLDAIADELRKLTGGK